MVNLFSLSRKPFVVCYCFREPIKTLFFDACQMKKKKNSVRNLQYGPKTRLIRDIYIYCPDTADISTLSKRDCYDTVVIDRKHHLV